MKVQKDINISTVIIKYFNTIFSIIDRTSGQKINKYIRNINTPST